MRVARSRRLPLALDMTPMIDCVFLLLIFFLTTSQLAELAASELDLPHERGAGEVADSSAGVVVNLDAQGRATIQEEPVTDEELMARAKAARAADPAAVPIVRADRGAPAARLNAVMAALGSGGWKSIRLATTPSTTEVEP
jgi:biopolymer transport protein ExbD